MKHSYHCKFCGKPGEVEYEPVQEFKLQIKKWLEIICCDRCGKFHEEKRLVQDRIFANCMVVIQTKKVQPRPKNADQILASLRTRISNRCIEFAELVCNHLKIQTVNDPAFADMLMDRPDMVNIICGKYFNGLRRQFRREYQKPHND